MWCALSSAKKNHFHFWRSAFKSPALLKLQRCVPPLPSSTGSSPHLTSPASAHVAPKFSRRVMGATCCRRRRTFTLNDGMLGRILNASTAGVVLLGKKSEESVCVSLMGPLTSCVCHKGFCRSHRLDASRRAGVWEQVCVCV